MENRVKLPIGIENFEEFRTEGFYYVDKTGFIKELLENWGKVNLITRPRRFGKSLNMNMLQYFFEYGCDSWLFEGLAISREKEYCSEYMGQFPVISITLKSVSAGNYDTARSMLCSVIGNEVKRFSFLLSDDRLDETDRKQFRALVNVGEDGSFLMADAVLADSLRLLCALLHRHYGKKAILLIDEYDVPLDKAQQSGYYDEMAGLIRNLFSQALKTNNSLHFAVLTGCLRISKESIFTGLNNLKVFSVTDSSFSRHFGFTDDEVRALLEYYGFAARFEAVKEWYDGYRMGNIEVYCPWDVINYIDMLCSEPDAAPRAFWVNTSGNEIIRNFIAKATPRTKREIEALVAGECIARKINQSLTYRDLYKNVDNLWSVLFTTGYLTQRGQEEDGAYRLAIPNREIRQIFTEQILEWFQEEARRDAPRLDAFCEAFLQEDAETAEELFNAYLAKTISIRDTGGRRGRKESFYHGILLGLLGHREDWSVSSNVESGDGYSDILIEDEAGTTGIVIEVKYSEDANLERACQEALAQIERLGYEARLRQEGTEIILKYGIACFKKRCRVLSAKDVCYILRKEE
ncbi:MAG: ATP-binding protein [Acetatifactor sp.]|nr:ATP-binding protein [Acetatifactor sp.]